MTDMIRYSSNDAATRMIDRIGMRRIDEILMDPRFGLYDKSRGGGLWVGKRFAKDGPRVPDPMHGISHGATVTQVCRFYYLLANNRLVAPEWTDQMLADMSDPGLRHKFVYALMTRAPDATIYRKSGTWRTWHSDSVWVKGGSWRNYILVAMVESPDGEPIIRNLLPAVEAVLQKGAKPALVAQPR
jgi:beta-lactamase class A